MNALALEIAVLAQAANQSDWWSEQFFGLNQSQRFVLLLTAIGCFTGIVITVAVILYSAIDSAHRRRAEAELKREMIERGMSADEIAKIIEATTPLADVVEG